MGAPCVDLLTPPTLSQEALTELEAILTAVKDHVAAIAKPKLAALLGTWNRVVVYIWRMPQ